METKKRRPNFFDIVFIVLILALAGGAYAISHGLSANQTVTTRTYLLEVAGLEPGMEQAVAVGSSVTDNIRNYEIGTVTQVEEVPSLGGVFDETSGVVRQTALPDQITLHVTVQVDTVETEKNVTTVSGYDLKTGKAVSCTMGEVTCSGYILHVDR